MTFHGLKIKWVYFCVNKLYAGTAQKHFEKKRKLLNSIGHDIGENTKIVGPLYTTARLVVGADCWIGREFKVNGNGTAFIGNNCDIAPEVSFFLGSHEIGDEERRAGKGYNADIKIGNGCWIGARTSVLCGVEIGDGCVVAACACVNKSLDKNILAGGVPACEIRKLSND